MYWSTGIFLANKECLLKHFFGYLKYSSVTNMLFELGTSFL